MLAAVLALYYRRCGGTLADRGQLANSFPIVTLVTVLLISVVKSSLALSLGLVGALSIVRFRTPIKEPEELAYLFICIAVGVTLGAGYLLGAAAGLAVILLVLTIWKRFTRTARPLPNLFLAVETQSEEAAASLRSTLDALAPELGEVDLRRLERRDGLVTSVFRIHVADPGSVERAIASIEKGLPGAAVTLVDHGSSSVGAD